jgi:hypothetical protein
MSNLYTIGAFTFDGPPEVMNLRCDSCGRAHRRNIGYVLRGGHIFATYLANWYPHEREAWLEVVMGSFVEPDFADHIMFACRIRPSRGNSGPAASLGQAPAQKKGDGKIFGHLLSPAEALAHPRLREFWQVTDWLVLNDELLRENLLRTPRKRGR